MNVVRPRTSSDSATCKTRHKAEERTTRGVQTYNREKCPSNEAARMRNTIRTTGLLSLLVAVAGCGDVLGERIIHGHGPISIEERHVGRFTGVANSSTADVEILHGFVEGVFVRAQDNLIPYVRTRVQNDMLHIDTDRDVTLRPQHPIVIEVDIVTLRNLESTGSGFMRGQLIDATRLELNSSGAGDIDLPGLLADSLIVISSGSGDVTAEGEVQRLRLNMSATGRVDTRDLEAGEAEATISGSGSATIRVRDHLRAILSGSGWLRYFGSPEVDADVTGTGQVERQGG